MEIIEDSGEKNGFLNLAIEQVLAEVSPNDSIKIVENIFLAAVNTNSDETALKWLKIYQDVSLKASLTKENFMTEVFPRWLIYFYKQIPNTKPTFLGPVSSVPKTKTRMMQHIIAGWGMEPSLLGYEIFSFLLKEHKRALEVFGHVYSYKEERERIPKLIKEHTGSGFTPEHLEKWMKYSPIPDDIMQVLAKAWVRNGGWKSLLSHFKAQDCLKMLEEAEYIRSSMVSGQDMFIRGRVNLVHLPCEPHTVRFHILYDCELGERCALFMRVCERVKKLFITTVAEEIIINIENFALETKHTYNLYSIDR